MKRNQTIYTCDYCQKEYIHFSDNFGRHVSGYMLKDLDNNDEAYLCSGECVVKYIDSKKVDIPSKFECDAETVNDVFCKLMANEISKAYIKECK
jgi:hypothetical protein